MILRTYLIRLLIANPTGSGPGWWGLLSSNRRLLRQNGHWRRWNICSRWGDWRQPRVNVISQRWCVVRRWWLVVEVWPVFGDSLSSLHGCRWYIRTATNSRDAIHVIKVRVHDDFSLLKIHNGMETLLNELASCFVSWNPQIFLSRWRTWFDLHLLFVI